MVRVPPYVGVGVPRAMQWLKDVFPFRLGTTSYILPDEILPNVRYLAGKLDDVELVLFESDEISPLPDEATLAELRRIGSESAVSYTVHLPIDVDLGHRDDRLRRRSVEKCRRVLRLTRRLDPFGWIVHLDGERPKTGPAGDFEARRRRLRDSLRQLAEAAPETSRLCVETLDDRFELVEELVASCGCSICLDVGHLVAGGHDAASRLRRCLAVTRIVHVHGVDGGRDHRGLGALPDGLLEELLGALRRGAEVPRVVTIEVFSERDLVSSVEVLRRYAPCRP